MSTRIGPYEIVREVARGGMGVVFQVRHPNVPRPLALKLILDAGKGGDTLQRFQREAQILAQCDRHPNVLKVHQLGVENGRPFLVTDFIEGAPLSKSIPMAPRRAATIIRKVADALAHVHAKGALHRDIKPDNIIIRSDAEDEPVLIDFGLAWAQDAEQLTRTGTTLGTPAFMSPEQAGGGKGAALDARSDVYSLGATLYAALTGSAPFHGDSLQELVAKIMTEVPRRPSDSQEAVPNGLDAICYVALGKKPENRYASAAELRDDLDRFLAGTAPRALARLPRRGLRARHIAFLVLASGLAVGLLGLLVRYASERALVASRERNLAAALDLAKSASLARRSDEARARADALDAAVAKLEPVDPRLARVTAFLRAEVEARDAREKDALASRTQALTQAVASARAYLRFPAGPEELLDEIPEREAALAAALADGGPEDVASALLARSEPRDGAPALSRAGLVDRALALLRLGHPQACARALEKIEGADGLAAEALGLRPVALLECRELKAARGAMAPLVASLKPTDAPGHARAAALAARIELASGDVEAARHALDAAPAADPETVLARGEVDLARRSPASAILEPVSDVLAKTHDESLALRAGELLGRAEVLDALEHFVARDEPPSFAVAQSALAAAAARLDRPGSGGGGGAETGRPAAARALVLLAALARARHDAHGASAALLRARAADPASIDAALAAASFPDETTRRALETAAAELPGLAAPLRALATGETAPASAQLDECAAAAEGAVERASFALLAVARAPSASSLPVAAVLAAEEQLRNAGTLDALLVEVAETRLALEDDAESLVLNGFAVSRTPAKDGAVAEAAATELSLGAAAAKGALRRGDAAVARTALDLVFALRIGWRTAAALRAAAAARMLRALPDEVAAAASLSPKAPATEAALRASSVAALVDEALADEAASRDLPADDLARARAALVRGRLLDAAGKAAEALDALKTAVANAERILGARNDERVTIPRLAEATRVRSGALEDTITATVHAGDAAGSAAANGVVNVDRAERATAGIALLEAVVATQRVMARAAARSSDVGLPGELLSEAAARRDALVAALRNAPGAPKALDACIDPDIESARTARGWMSQIRAFVARGGLGAYYGSIVDHFFTFLMSGGADMEKTLLSADEIEDAAGPTGSDDPARILALAVHGIFEILVSHEDHAAKATRIAAVDSGLLRVRRLMPGSAAVLAWRAAGAIVAKRPADANGLFALSRELAGWTTHTIDSRTFEGIMWFRASELDPARRAFAAIRDAPDLTATDHWVIDNRPVDEIAAADPEIRSLREAIHAAMRGH